MGACNVGEIVSLRCERCVLLEGWCCASRNEKPKNQQPSTETWTGIRFRVSNACDVQFTPYLTAGLP